MYSGGSATLGCQLFWDICASGSVDHRHIDAHFRIDIGYEIKIRKHYSRVSACQSTRGREYLCFVTRGFKLKVKVLKLWKTLYGLGQSTRVFCKYLAENNPCLFIGDNVIYIVYINDLLFWAKYEADMTQVELRLLNKGIDREQEDSSSWLLGVKLEHDYETSLILMCQDGLIDSVIAQLRLNDGADKFKWDLP